MNLWSFESVGHIGDTVSISAQKVHEERTRPTQRRERERESTPNWVKMYSGYMREENETYRSNLLTTNIPEWKVNMKRWCALHILSPLSPPPPLANHLLCCSIFSSSHHTRSLSLLLLSFVSSVSESVSMCQCLSGSLASVCSVNWWPREWERERDVEWEKSNWQWRYR